MEDYYWWEAYGRFSPGDGNLPCLGEVINYYMTVSQVTPKDLADALGCTERYVNKMRSSENKNHPEMLSRRIFIAKKLGIPAVLLGLSPMTFAQWGDGTASSFQVPGISPEMIAGPATMQRSEQLLSLSWDMYYTSSVQKARPLVDQNYEELTRAFQHATGLMKDQFDAMRCRFLQLYSLIHRDQGNIEQALEVESEAVNIAYHLKNAELIASSLQRRARILVTEGRHEEGRQDALKAISYGDLSRDPIKGKCYQIAGEAVSYLANGRRAWQDQSIEYFDRAIDIARSGNLAPDGSFYKMDLTSALIEKAEALTLFRRYQDAHLALETAEENLSPSLTRWRLNLLLAKAKVYLGERSVTDAAYVLIDALGIARDLQLPKKIARIKDLHEQAAAIEPGNTQLIELAQQLAL